MIALPYQSWSKESCEEELRRQEDLLGKLRVDRHQEGLNSETGHSSSGIIQSLLIQEDSVKWRIQMLWDRLAKLEEMT